MHRRLGRAGGLAGVVVAMVAATLLVPAPVADAQLGHFRRAVRERPSWR